jgi:hypothetical protein
VVIPKDSAISPFPNKTFDLVYRKRSSSIFPVSKNFYPLPRLLLSLKTAHAGSSEASFLQLFLCV